LFPALSGRQIQIYFKSWDLFSKTVVKARRDTLKFTAKTGTPLRTWTCGVFLLLGLSEFRRFLKSHRGCCSRIFTAGSGCHAPYMQRRFAAKNLGDKLHPIVFHTTSFVTLDILYFQMDGTLISGGSGSGFDADTSVPSKIASTSSPAAAVLEARLCRRGCSVTPAWNDVLPCLPSPWIALTSWTLCTLLNFEDF
jgi:hypothetical protein